MKAINALKSAKFSVSLSGFLFASNRRRNRNFQLLALHPVQSSTAIMVFKNCMHLRLCVVISKFEAKIRQHHHYMNESSSDQEKRAQLSVSEIHSKLASVDTLFRFNEPQTCIYLSIQFL
jgi:hypothetical protein